MAYASKITMTIGDAPGTPSSGTLIIYAKSDKKYYFKDSDGVETALAGSSGTSGTSGSSGTGGSAGTHGTSGSSGTHGTSGTPGSSGSSGTHGTSGSSGTHGTSGSTGSAGTSGTSGTGYPIRCVQIVVVDPVAQVGTGNGKAYFVVPDELTNMNLVRIAATLIGSAGTGGSCGVAITNTGSSGTASVAMLGTNMQIEGSELSTRTSSTPGAINTSADGIVTGDLIRIDIPNVHTTAGTGLIVEMAFTL
jgi:hypothetical protein